MVRVKFIVITLFFCVYAFAFKDLGVFGNTYEPAEPDGMEEILEKAKDLNKTKLLKEFKEAFYKQLIANYYVPPCEKNATRYFTPVYTLNQDIVMPDGKVLYKKGYQFKPLSRLFFNRAIAFVNSKDKESLEFVLKNNPSAQIFLSEGNLTELSKRYGRNFDKLDKIYAQKFNLKCVPSIYFQDRDSFKIVEYKINDKEFKK